MLCNLGTLAAQHSEDGDTGRSLRATQSLPPLPQWSSWIRFERVVLEQNRYREYTIAISRDLFGEWAVVRSWGRISGRHQVKATFFTLEADATTLAEQIAHRRLLHGYQVTAFA